MACSKQVKSVTVDFGPLAPQIMDGLIQHHQVGGLCITQFEFDRLRAIWEGVLEWCSLPCRLQEVASYFTRMGSGVVMRETTFNLCRLSLGIKSEALRTLDVCFEEEKSREGKNKIDLVIRWLLQHCTIKEEQYILENSFIVPYCNDHDMCKLFHQMDRGSERKPIRFNCCHAEKCKEFCNFQICLERLGPLHKVVKATSFLKQSCTPCPSKKCKFC